MATISTNKMIEAFPFLDDRTVQEPYLFDVINEIATSQTAFQKGKKNQLATRENIKKSRHIKMPFTPARNKNIDFIIDLLLERFGEHIIPVVSFEMSFDEKEKKLKFLEKEEFTSSLKPEEFKQIEIERDKKSLDNFLNLISRFRVFNLSKLFRKVKRKEHFSRVLKQGENITFFIYKSFTSDKNQMVTAQDLCFHVNNYESVKKSLNMNSIKSIIENHREMVGSRLKKYGILNSDFSNISESKVDYLLHILIDDLAGTIANRDIIEAKSFKSLRDCISRVDKLLDPSRIYGNDILKTIRSYKFCYDTDITSNIMNVTDEITLKWANYENLTTNHIVKFMDPTGKFYFINGPDLYPEFKELYHTKRFEPEKLQGMTSFQKQFNEKKLEILYSSSKEILNSDEIDKYLNCNKDTIANLKKLVEEFEDYLKEKSALEEISSIKSSTKEKKSFIQVIADIFKAIFGLFSSSKIESTEAYSSNSSHSKLGTSSSISGVREKSSSGNISKSAIMKETQTIYAKARSRSGPIIALSDILELSQENNVLIDKVIKEMRDNNLKVIMPVYGARKKLYPKRSQKIILADMEYLLIPIESIKTSESITSYVDSLVGFKMHDDILSGNMLIEVEKYLRTIHRQKRAQLLKRD